MQENKFTTITKLFDGSEIRSIWDAEKEDYYFSVVDVIKVLTNSSIPKRYWSDLKNKLFEEGSQLYDNVVQLKMKSPKDGKFYKHDVLDTKGILRLIESVPSPKAEPFKVWLATLGKERIDEIYDPELAINRAIKYYKNHGYDDNWIENRLKGILERNKLTDIWKQQGIKEPYEYAELTNDIYNAWSGMTAKEYKKFKGIRKESLRDHMTEIEVLLTNLGELTTKELVKQHKPYGLESNKMFAKIGGNVANNTRKDLENTLDRNVISRENKLIELYNKNKNKEIK